MFKTKSVLELKIEGMGTYGHVLIQIFSAKTAVCPLSNRLTFLGKSLLLNCY
jgi:hypothetical protein